VGQLESIDGSNWKSFLESPVAVLVLGKTDCENCARWSQELEEFLASDQEFSDVRFGKLMLDQRGLVDFKRHNPWIGELEVLPYNVLYARGEKQREFAGSGVERLANRLRRLRDEGLRDPE